MKKSSRLVIVLFPLLSFWNSALSGGSPRALPAGQLPSDVRLGELRTLNSYFPFQRVRSTEEWARRSAELERQVRVAMGVWPMPTRTPLHPVIHGKVDRAGYTVEKVFFESLPGHFVTGNLYRPKGRSGRLPGVLSPHGHTGSEATRRENGRMHDHGPEQVRREIARGGERFVMGGRHPLQARAVQLARMGCVVFQYDMVGYSDSLQLPHKGLGVRGHMNAPENWGFSSPRAELHLQSLMGLQTWNSLRALDFLLSLPDVDPGRVAVEAHSGGGTQTFILMAIDPRPSVSFPAVMVSTAMQGGCLCENAPYLRIGAGNVDIAALTAPRPMGMTGADDWTIEIEEKGFPDLKELYEMLGSEDLVFAKAFPQFGHNYNSVSRTVMYNWLNRHLGLGFEEPVIEEDYVPLTREEASVWDDEHPAPSGEQAGEAHERAVLRWMTRDAEKQMSALVPNDPASLERYREIVGGAVHVMIGRNLTDVQSTHLIPTEKSDLGSALLTVGLLRHDDREELPVAQFQPRSGGNGEIIVWIHELGEKGLFTSDGKPAPGVVRMLERGYRVVGVDLLYQGEFLEEGDVLQSTRMVARGDDSEPWQQAALFTFGYNYPLFSRRVQDILTVVRHFQTASARPAEVSLIGLGKIAGPLVAGAAAQAQGALHRVAIDTGGFRFQDVARFDDPMFLPGAAKYLDLPGMLSLAAGTDLWIAGEKELPRPVLAAYEASGESDRVSFHTGPNLEATAVQWLVR